MPFYLTNENIEATMQRNPDDTFHPSNMNQKHFSKNIKIRQLISQEIQHTLESYMSKEVECDLVCNVDLFEKNMRLSYLFTFETDNDEYEMTYHIPTALLVILEQHSQDDIDTKRVFSSLSDSIVICLNAQQDYAFLQDIELIDLCEQTVDYEKNKILKNLYSIHLTIDKIEYNLYLQLDDQFNKTF